MAEHKILGGNEPSSTSISELETVVFSGGSKLGKENKRENRKK